MNRNLRALLILPALAGLLPAQPVQPRRPGRIDAPEEEGFLPRRLRQVRINQMREGMGLPDAQAAAIADRWAQHDREFVQSTRQLNQLRGQFREILFGPGGEDDKSARVKPLLEQFMELRKLQADSRARFETDIRAGLSPAQQARLIMLVEEITRRLQEGLANRPGLLRRGQQP